MVKTGHLPERAICIIAEVQWLKWSILCLSHGLTVRLDTAKILICNDLIEGWGNEHLASNLLTFWYARTSSRVLGACRVRMDSLKEGQHLDQSQRRRSPRIRLQVPVFLRGSDSSGVEFIELTKTLNIGSAGACITSTHMLRIDQVVYLTVPAPSPASSSLVPNETPPIAAKVLRQDVVGDMRLFGLEFLRPLE
jgi:hypothetical protein